jgi:hypothetical protein
MTLDLLRETLRRKPLAPDLGGTPMSQVPVPLRRLATQVQACIRGLTQAEIEFALCHRIGNQAARLAYEVNPSRHSLETDLVDLLGRVRRPRHTCAGISSRSV